MERSAFVIIKRSESASLLVSERAQIAPADALPKGKRVRSTGEKRRVREGVYGTLRIRDMFAKGKRDIRALRECYAFACAKTLKYTKMKP